MPNKISNLFDTMLASIPERFYLKTKILTRKPAKLPSMQRVKDTSASHATKKKSSENVACLSRLLHVKTYIKY